MIGLDEEQVSHRSSDRSVQGGNRSHAAAGKPEAYSNAAAGALAVDDTILRGGPAGAPAEAVPEGFVNEFRATLECLNSAGVDFIIVGGVAAILHGSARFTLDLDIVYDRSRPNLERLVLALAIHRPYLRGAPPGLPFLWDTATLERGLNFTLTTQLGDLDLLGEVTGGGGYRDLLPLTEEIEVGSNTYRVVTLEKLIQLKRATGRPKDLEAIAELEALREETE